MEGKTREELVAALDGARTARDVELAEVTARHQAVIDAAEQAVVDFDNNVNVEEEVEAEVVGEGVEAEVEDVEEVEEELPEDDEESPTAEEEEILRRAAEIEAKYQR